MARAEPGAWSRAPLFLFARLFFPPLTTSVSSPCNTNFHYISGMEQVTSSLAPRLPTSSHKSHASSSQSGAGSVAKRWILLLCFKLWTDSWRLRSLGNELMTLMVSIVWLLVVATCFRRVCLIRCPRHLVSLVQTSSLLQGTMLKRLSSLRFLKVIPTYLIGLAQSKVLPGR